MIKVESVQVSTTDEPIFKRLTITAEARVETVTRSASGLKPGDAIRISYVHLDHKQPLAGPSEPDVLQKGQSYPAFLAKAGKDETYTIAARGYSFRTVN
jgi:FKBP-type peptidyl-prolyl cis-trans isomerase (trigger factor)